MKLFIVMAGFYHEESPQGVFSSLEKATAFLLAIPEEYAREGAFIVPAELDQPTVWDEIIWGLGKKATA